MKGIWEVFVLVLQMFSKSEFISKSKVKKKSFFFMTLYLIEAPNVPIITNKLFKIQSI